MDRKIWMILQRIDKNLLLAAKQVLNMDEAMLLTGLSKSHLYRLTSSCDGIESINIENSIIV